MMALNGKLPARNRVRIPAFSRTGSLETYGWLLLPDVSDVIRSRGGNTQAKKAHTIEMDGFEEIFTSPTRAVKVVQRRSTEKRDDLNGWKFIYFAEGPHAGQTLDDFKKRQEQSRKRPRALGGHEAAAAAGGADASPSARSRLHEILNLDPSASQKQIKKAYKEACLRMHPDKNPDNQEALAAFQALQEAHNAYNAA